MTPDELVILRAATATLSHIGQSMVQAVATFNTMLALADEQLTAVRAILAKYDRRPPASP